MSNRKEICNIAVFICYNMIMRHLVLEDRLRIRGMQKGNIQEEAMASIMWCSTRTIRREIERGSTDGQYYPKKAQEQVDTGRRNNGQSRIKLLQGNWYAEILKSRLEAWVSTPDSIAGRMKSEWETFVCTKTIYNYIWLYDWWLKKLLTYKKRYKKHHSRQWKRPAWYRHISQRSVEANKRTEVWHMEIDLVMSQWNKAWVMTLVDRKSRFWLVMKVNSKGLLEINRVLKSMVRKEWIQKKLKTITSDNGREFFWLRHIEKSLSFEQYYADPYSSRQRWTNEQYNRQIRKLFPKWTDFSKVGIKTIMNLQTKLNKKPRKILWYRSPEEVFYQC